MKFYKKERKGFTLAEVLITLGIIGVVAALTIPTLIANYQKTQYVAALKKSYAEVTEALKLMANDHGCPDDLRCTGVFNWNTGDGSNHTILGNEFKKYFKLAKDCGITYNANDESTKCMTDSYSPAYNTYLGNRSDLNTFAGGYRLITADGFSISLSSYGPCNLNWAHNSDKNLNMSAVCGVMYIDVNGLKGPNSFGRDIFWFFITNGKGPAIYPAGGSELATDGGWASSWLNSSGNPSNCYYNSSTDQNTTGTNCAGRIMEQGWQMLY